jgi:hypothetical protein
MLQATKAMIPAVSSLIARDAEPARTGFPRRDPASITQLMSQHLDLACPATDSEALRLLRQAFPGAPLTARVEVMARRAR